jgi:hypothetical protein
MVEIQVWWRMDPTKHDRIHAKSCLFHAKFPGTPTPDGIAAAALKPKNC